MTVNNGYGDPKDYQPKQTYQYRCKVCDAEYETYAKTEILDSCRNRHCPGPVIMVKR